MFAKSIVAGLSRLLCVMAVTGAFAVPAVQAQNATNTATLTPPAGVTIPTTNPSCRDTDSDTTTSVSLASNVCTATDSDPITAPQLRLTKTASTSPMVVGVAASYTLKVDNIGTAATTAAATVTDTIPTGLTIGTLPAGCTNPSGQTVSCTIQPGLAATNGTISFVIPVTPTAAAGTSITNTARVSGGGDATCPAEERCTGTVITPVAKPELELTKTATLVADQTTITYTFSARNTGGVALNNVTVSDTKLTGLSCSPIATLAINATQSFTCTGHVYTVSNVATATVQMVSDPMMDESTILGSVFDDRDGDGWQDNADMSDIRVQGGFDAGAYVANSTTVDRGNGPQPEADASSPMLHGIDIGSIGGRQSDADPASARQVVVSQLLRSPTFTGDFVLTTKQGVTLRMDAAGNTTVKAEGGDAAKGLSAALPSVQRKVSPADGGYRVDYVIANEGVDERGIPGVRIASVEGLLVETDQFGRYNLIGVEGGRDDRGRNFILKVDPATLPPGSVFTTKNPLVRRITPGLPVRFDFGVKLPPGLVEGQSTEKVEMELGEVMFAPASAEVRSQYLPAVEKMAEQVRNHGGGEVVIGAHGEDELLAFDRAVAVRKALVAALPADIAARTQVSLRTNTIDEQTTVVGLLSWPVLGNALFDTDKATIKPEYDALLARIANYLVEMDSRIIKIVGHADRRASDEHKFDIDIAAGKDAPAIRDQLDVDVTGRYMFAVALADFTLSGGSVSGSLEPLGNDDRYEKDLVVDGRLAFYLKGKVKGKYLVTAQADTQEHEVNEMFKGFWDADPQDIFRRLDPDQYYPVYGDDSTTYRDVDTQGRLYVRVDWDKSQALWGNFNTGITGTEYGQYSRSLYGGALSWRSRGTNPWGDATSEVRAFGSEAQSAPGHSEFLGTGGSLYYLRHNDILPGSEKVAIEIRDATTGRVEKRVELQSGADYQIDEFQGRLILSDALSIVTRDGLPRLSRDTPLDGYTQVLLVDYEYLPTGFNPDEVTAGVRGKHWFCVSSFQQYALGSVGPLYLSV